jgi:hypothetical protein
MGWLCSPRGEMINDFNWRTSSEQTIREVQARMGGFNINLV